MAWTNNSTSTLPATGSRVVRYHATNIARQHRGRVRRRVTLCAALLVCAAWARGEPDPDPAVQACIDDCKKSDHVNCEPVCRMTSVAGDCSMARGR